MGSRAFGLIFLKLCNIWTDTILPSSLYFPNLDSINTSVKRYDQLFNVSYNVIWDSDYLMIGKNVVHKIFARKLFANIWSSYSASTECVQRACKGLHQNPEKAKYIELFMGFEPCEHSIPSENKSQYLILSFFHHSKCTLHHVFHNLQNSMRGSSGKEGYTFQVYRKFESQWNSVT